MTTTSKTPAKTKTTKTAAVKPASKSGAKAKTSNAAKKAASVVKTKAAVKAGAVAKTSPAVETNLEVIADAAEVQVSTAPKAKPVAKTRIRKTPIAGATGGRMLRKTRMGQVISDKMDKTVVVAVERLVRHPLYGRILKRTTKLKAHDQQNECRIGDKVKLMETRPLSRDKRWRVVSIIEKAK